jgi:hypothetical protein
MKYLLLIMSLFSFMSPAFSQDSIKIRTEVDTFKQSNYEGQFDYVFARKEPKKQMFKLGGMINQVDSYLELAYERKLTQDFSLNLSLSNTIQGDVINNIASKFKIIDQNYVYTQLHNTVKFGIEPRWYYTMKKDIKSGLISDNLNGNYIGLRTNMDYEKHIESRLNSFNVSHELTWGIQRRILSNQYIDFNMGAGFYYRSNHKTRFDEIETKDKGIFNYRFTYGFILDNHLLKKKKALNCDALRCFEEEKSLWKIGLSNALTATEQSILTQLSISNESKINNSQWSVETKLSINAGTYKYSTYKFSGDNYGLGLQITPRFYWDLNKRIAKGVSANNLSGKYLGLIINGQLGQGHYISSSDFSNYNVALSNKTISIIPVIGYQKRLLDHLFLDMNIGYGATRSNAYVTDKLTGKSSNSTGSYWNRSLSTNFTFGFSF